jgi:hypothetical protein
VDITEFVKARLDEDEAAAKAALESEWFAHVTEFASANHYDTFGDLAVEYWQWFPGEADGVHAALHDPARVLREVAAKRRILAGHGPGSVIDDSNGKWRDDPENWDAPVTLCAGHEWVAWPCETVRLLAAIWGDHPDYRAEWKP